MCVSLPTNKLLEMWLALPLLQTLSVTVHEVMSFLARPNFAPTDMYDFANYVVSFRKIC